MIEIRTILAPTDFSPHAEKAVRYACGLAERLGAELHLLHVLSEIVPAGPDPMLDAGPAARVLPGDRGAVARDARPARSTPPGARPDGRQTAVRWGSPVEAIVDYAGDQRDRPDRDRHPRPDRPEPRPARLGRRADRPRGPLPRPDDPLIARLRVAWRTGGNLMAADAARVPAPPDGLRPSGRDVRRAFSLTPSDPTERPDRASGREARPTQTLSVGRSSGEREPL